MNLQENEFNLLTFKTNDLKYFTSNTFSPLDVDSKINSMNKVSQQNCLSDDLKTSHLLSNWASNHLEQRDTAI